MVDIDARTPPFDKYKNIQRLAPARSGPRSEYARHQLYVGRDSRTSARALIKLASKPGTVYQRDLANEIATLTTINRELADTRYFPLVFEHGTLRDGRVYLVSSLFDEFPIAMSIDAEPVAGKMVGHLRTAIEIARALSALHGIGIFHVDLNPMNVLHRTERGRPIIRIIDFESSYERTRHAAGEFYNPPTTPGYSAPEVSSQPPDARADVFSLGALLYTLVAGYDWAWKADVTTTVAGDKALDSELKRTLQRAVAAAPDKRHPTMDALGTDLSAYLEKIWPGRSW